MPCYGPRRPLAAINGAFQRTSAQLKNSRPPICDNQSHLSSNLWRTTNLLSSLNSLLGGTWLTSTQIPKLSNKLNFNLEIYWHFFSKFEKAKNICRDRRGRLDLFVMSSNLEIFFKIADVRRTGRDIARWDRYGVGSDPPESNGWLRNCFRFLCV